MSRLKKRLWIIILIVIVLIAVCCYFILPSYFRAGEVVTQSLSDDAHYSITADAKNYIILWDLQTHQKRIVSRDGDMYSAYWIKGTPYFMWQNLKTLIVYVQNAQGDVIKTINPGFIVYGQAMSSDLKNYIASNNNWDLYVIQNGQKHLLAKQYDGGGFEAANKLVNFTFIGNDQVLTSGLTDVVTNGPQYQHGIILWDLNTLKKIHDYIGNEMKTVATASPNQKYLVAVDDSGRQFVWNKESEQLLVNVMGGWPLIKDNPDGSAIFDQNVIPLPKDAVYRSYSAGHNFAIKFIDANHYLRFNTLAQYAALYETPNSKPIKYLDLGTKPEPSTWDFERDESIDTSPTAHILVTGKEFQGGIMVYQYDPKNQTLTKVWDGT